MPATAEQLRQYESLSTGVLVANLAARTHLELTGGDRASFLHGLCTNDIKKLQPGQGCEAYVTNVQGKTIGHLYVYCGPDSLILESHADQGAMLATHFDRYLIREDVQIVDRTEAWGELLLTGNGADEWLSKQFAGPLPVDLFAHVEVPWSNQRVSLRRVDFVAAPSWFVVGDRPIVAEVLEALVDQGAVPASDETVESLRIEAGTPLFGRDITPDNLPQELGRDRRAISFTKGCYLGQETVARIDALGHVNRRLIRVLFENEPPPPPGTPLMANEKTVGQVTSSCFSPRLGKSLALAYVRRGHEQAGSKLSSTFGEAEVV